MHRTTPPNLLLTLLLRLVFSAYLGRYVGMMRFGAPRAAWVFRGLAVLIAAQFTVAYVLGTNFYVDLAAYAHGAARLPFQTRALTGWAMRAVLWGGGLPDRDARAVLAGLVFGAVLAVFASARVVAGQVAGPGLARAAALGFTVPLYVMFAAPAYDYRFSYPYDLPSLALFFAALAAFLRGRVGVCVGVFVLAALSRETCLVLIGVVLLWPWVDWRKRVGLGGALSLVWVGAFAVTHRLYAGNVREADFMHQLALPGGMVIELGNNWQDLRDPWSWPALLSVFAWAWLPVGLFWRRLDHVGLRRSILVLTPVWVLLMFTVGRLREVRVFSELTVIYWFALVWIVARMGKAREGQARQDWGRTCDARSSRDVRCTLFA